MADELAGYLHSRSIATSTVWGSISTPAKPEDSRTGGQHRAELDAHRALAVLATVAFTVYQFCNVGNDLLRGSLLHPLVASLDAAVPWLFVLIAFLVFEPIARAVIDRQPTEPVARLVARRAGRVLPLYWLAVVVVWFPRQHALPGDWRDLLEHLTFTQVFDSKRIFYTIGPAWAVSVGAICCLLLIAIGSMATYLVASRDSTRAQRAWSLAATSVLLALVAVGWKAWSFGVRDRPTGGSFTTWFGPVANLDSFALGMAVAIAVVLAPATTTRSRTVLRLAGLAILVLAFAVRRPDSWTAVYFTTLCSIGFACLVAAAAGTSRPDGGKKGIAATAFRWLSAAGFGTFLWHEPLMLALHAHGLIRQSPAGFDLKLLVVSSGAIGCGWASSVVIQRPVARLLSTLRPADRRGTAVAAVPES